MAVDRSRVDMGAIPPSAYIHDKYLAGYTPQVYVIIKTVMAAFVIAPDEGLRPRWEGETLDSLPVVYEGRLISPDDDGFGDHLDNSDGFQPMLAPRELQKGLMSFDIDDADHEMAKLIGYCHFLAQATEVRIGFPDDVTIDVINDPIRLMGEVRQVKIRPAIMTLDIVGL